jgi:phospholipid transport system substrate-binding protein
MRMRSYALTALSCLAFFLPPQLLYAQATQTTQASGTKPVINPKMAEAFIKELSDKAFAVLRDEKLTEEQREQRFRVLLREGFALDVIGEAVLGINRRTATPAQLSQFNAAFPDFIIKTFSCPLQDNKNAVVRILGTASVGSRGDVQVMTSVTSPSLASAVKADWRVRLVPGRGLRVIDLTVEGVSLGVAQRDSFNAKIQKSGFDAVLEDIKTIDQSCRGSTRSAARGGSSSAAVAGGRP